MIFVARQLIKCREHNQPLHMAFIDLTKAFDSVNPQALWLVLAKIDRPEKYIRVLFRESMQTAQSGHYPDTNPPSATTKQ